MPDSASPTSRPLAGQNRSLWWRNTKDRMATLGMGVGGSAVIVAIVLIFFYLLYVTMPLFASPEATVVSRYALPAPTAGKTLHTALEEQNRIAVRYTDLGRAIFFNAASGAVLLEQPLLDDDGPALTVVKPGDLAGHALALGLADGSVRIAAAKYQIHYDEHGKTIEPAMTWPLGEASLPVADNPISDVAVGLGEESNIVLATAGNNLHVLWLTRAEGLMLDDEEPELETSTAVFEDIGPTLALMISADRRTALAVLPSGEALFLDIAEPGEASIIEMVELVPEGVEVTALEMLTGGISLLVGDSKGRMSQWFPVRDAEGAMKLTRIRQFQPMAAAVTEIVTEQRRKGFYAISADGHLAMYYSTANRRLINHELEGAGSRALAVSPRADRFLVEDEGGNIQFGVVDNEHPEISFGVLWSQVWYESYQEPAYIWQSSSASNDFEPKFSLMPLTFGTIKAAFYAMLFAIPLAIFGAIYTAYFMAPKMRALVKPSIEIMEALPTVILGFLAGLWLAPLVEADLAGVLLSLLLLPPGVISCAWLWSVLPRSVRGMVPEGWQAALLIVPVMLITWVSFVIGGMLEAAWFGGDLPQWFSSELGWSYDQRNSLVVGIAMGVAVIPTIFSITEDAIFSVPKHLTLGSLALGATAWQTLTRVVILTASPGIFSAIMIGLGRAVGETMIVLMATGNTAVMDMSIFQGMRTLSANIAVEMPESEVGSSHYRILFLAALVLFVLTFFFNTVAEIIRQRLRRKYSSL